MKNFILLSVLVFSSLPAIAGDLDPKMDSIVKQFTRDAAAKNLGTGVTAAVFPYSCDEKLTKKRVDVAIVELLTTRLLKAGTFKLAERNQLETIMKEQKLALSGAIESATAAQVGKLAGARLAVLGNVIRVGRSYQISSKLVDTESAEIISASIVEVPIATFDEEAARYLVLVPEREALGLYVGLSYFPVVKKKLPTVTNPAGTGMSITPRNAKASYDSMEIGLRYQAAKNTILDFSFLADANIGGGGDMFTINQAPEVNSDSSLSGYGFRISANRTAPLSRSLALMYGIGFQGHIWRFFKTSEPVELGSSSINMNPQSKSIYTLFGRIGAEWRPAGRFGWGLFSQFNQPKKLICTIPVRNSGAAAVGVKVFEAAFPVITVNTTFAFYF